MKRGDTVYSMQWERKGIMVESCDMDYTFVSNPMGEREFFYHSTNEMLVPTRLTLVETILRIKLDCFD